MWNEFLCRVIMSGICVFTWELHLPRINADKIRIKSDFY